MFSIYLIIEIFFFTKTMFFIGANNQEVNIDFDREQRLQECRETSYFYNQDHYELLPDDFKILLDMKEILSLNCFKNSKLF